MDKKTVLLADDQPFIMERVAKRLSENYIIETVTSGDEALKRIEGGGLDLIILDNSMPPGPKGSYIAKQVRKNYPDIPVVLQSGDYETFGYLEEHGIKVMNKFDRDGIVAYVKQTLGE